MSNLVKCATPKCPNAAFLPETLCRQCTMRLYFNMWALAFAGILFLFTLSLL